MSRLQPSPRVALTSLLALALAGTSYAGDHYVDVLNGNDANDGSTPAQAWKTITHAIATLPYVTGTATEVIHVAPGVYSPASGEVLPLRPKIRFQVVGDAGPAVTVIEGGGGGPLFLFMSVCHFGGNQADPDTIVQGLTLRGAGFGVQADSRCGAQDPTLRDLVIRAMSSAGVRASSTNDVGGNRFMLTLERVRIEDCAVGVDLDPRSTQCFLSSAALTDCTVARCAQEGLRLVNPWGRLDVSLVRTSVVENGTGLRVEETLTMGTCGPVQTRVTLADSAVCGQLGHGIELLPQGTGGSSPAIELDLARCTVAGNGGTGIDAFALSAFHPVLATLASSIVDGNADDLRENPVLPSFAVSFCEIGDGDFAGSNGNISAPPLFRAPRTGDWRLAFGSPCIDTGDSATRPGALDLARAVRPVDGDLDAQERVDMGAFEFRPLELAAPAHVGGACVLELWGPGTASAVLIASRAGTSPPIATPFGEYDLGLHGVRVGLVDATPGPPSTFTIQLSPDRLLAGRTFSFQMLCPSTVAARTLAWSNGLAVTVLP